jgi:hypothetical protein
MLDLQSLIYRRQSGSVQPLLDGGERVLGLIQVPPCSRNKYRIRVRRGEHGVRFDAETGPRTSIRRKLCSMQKKSQAKR